MKIKTIRQSVTFRGATPREVYEAIMDSKKQTKATGMKAKMTRKIGGAYTAGDGYITGRNLELVPDKLIVQSWQADEDAWPKEHFSIVRFRFTKTPAGTRLDFSHSGVPAALAVDTAGGWHEWYWEPMKLALAK